MWQRHGRKERIELMQRLYETPQHPGRTAQETQLWRNRLLVRQEVLQEEPYTTLSLQGVQKTRNHGATQNRDLIIREIPDGIALHSDS